jgi:hypothetical protein
MLTSIHYASAEYLYLLFSDASVVPLTGTSLAA